MNLTTCLVLLVLFLPLAQTALSASLSSYLTLTQTQYTLNLTFSTLQIPSGTVPTLSLSSHYHVDSSTLLSCTSLLSSASSYSSCSCLASSNSSGTSVTFPDVYQSAVSAQTSLSLKFTINNPWAATTESLTLALISSASTLASSFTSITFSASALGNCSWSSSSPINGDKSSRTVSFLPSVPVIAGSYLSISLPYWYGTLLNLASSSPACTALTNVDGTLSCSNTTNGVQQFYQVSNLFASNKTVAGVVSLSLGTVSNPWSTAPFGPISFSLLYADTATAYLSQQCTGVYQSTSQKGTMSSFRINFLSSISYKSFFQTGWFKITNPLPASGGQLHINWSGGVSITVSTGSSPSLLSANSSYVVLGSFSSDYYPNSNISVFSRFTVVAPPSSRVFSITATTYYQKDGTLYGVDSSTATFSCVAGSLSPASVSTNSTNIGATAQLTLAFTLGHAVYSGSIIAVTFPQQMSVSGSCSTNITGISCLVKNTTFSNLTVTATINAATVVAVTFGTVSNPAQALTTSSFKVSSYIDYLTDGLIDQVSSGLTLTYAASPLPSDSLHLLPSNTTTHVFANYTLSAQLDNPIPANGYLEIVLPSQLTVTSPLLLDASFPTSSCNLTINGHNLTLNGCFPAGLVSLSLYIVLGPIGNPPSLATTAPLQFYTFGASGSIDYLLDGPTVTMTALAVSTSLSVVPASVQVHLSAVYTFGITFFTSRAAGDYLLLVVPSGMTVLPGVTCSPLSGVAALSCSALNSTVLKVTLVALPALTISFSANSLQNYDIGSKVTLKLTTYSSLGLASEVTYGVDLTFTPTLLTASTLLNNQLVQYKASNVSVVVSAPFQLASTLAEANTRLTLTLPTDVTSLANTSCSVASKVCSIDNSTSFSIDSVGLTVSNLTITLVNLLLSYPSVSGSFSIYYSYSGSPVASVSSGLTVGIYCVSPCQQCGNSSSLCVSCLPSPNTLVIYFPPNSSCLSACPLGYFLSGSACLSCMPSCSSCNTSVSCISCAPSYFMLNGTCTDTCPLGTYLVNGSCLACDDVCLSCNSTSTLCLACSASRVFYSNSCLAACPAGTYNSSGVCLACSSNCLNCSQFSQCSACALPLLMNTDNTCLSACPVGSIPDTTASVCLLCTNNCTTCLGTTANCLSCPFSLLLYSSQCISACPSNYFNVSGSCRTCGNCLTCLGPSSCSVCLSSYYLFGGVCYSSCPAESPVPDPGNMLCTRCGTICSSCVSPSECTSCNSPYVLLLGTCLQQCPSGYQINYSSNTCSKIVEVSYVYTPTSVATAALLVLAVLSKLVHPASTLVPNAAAIVSIGASVSTIILTLSVTHDSTIDTGNSRMLAQRALSQVASQSIMAILGITALGLSVFLGVGYVLWLGHRYSCDAGLRLWRQRSLINRYCLNLILVLTLFRMATLRMSYGRWFGRQCFSCYLKANSSFLKHSNIFTGLFLVLSTAPAIAVSLLILVFRQGERQTQLFAVDCLVLSALEAVLLILDMCLMGKQHFTAILKDLAYLRKFRKYQEMESSDGSLISIQEPEETHPKTQANANTPSRLPPGFGAFEDELQASRESIAKTLPEQGQLDAAVQFDPYEEKRKNDDLFFRERQYTNKFNELKESYQREGMSEHPDQNTENELFPRKTVEDLIRQLPRKKAKTVEEMIKEKPREVDPADYLKHIIPEDHQKVSKEDKLFLDNLSDKHQLDKPFLTSTLGTKKHFNFTLLSKAIDHHQVPSASVQQLINPNNKPQTLQAVLGRDSQVQPQQIRDVLKDEQGPHIIKSLFGQEEGVFSSATVKDILLNFSTEFIKTLTASDEVDSQKLRSLVVCKGQEEEIEGLKALREVGGMDLQKKQLLQNIIGQQSELDPTLIPKIGAEMSEKSRANIFGKKSHANSTVIRKVINNKGISLEPLNPINEMPQIVEEFAELLNCGNEKMERELTQVLERGTYDGQLLKQLVSQAGNSQEEMGKLLSYIDEHKYQEQLDQVERERGKPGEGGEPHISSSEDVGEQPRMGSEDEGEQPWMGSEDEAAEEKMIARLPSRQRDSTPVDVWPSVTTPDVYEDYEQETAGNYLDFDLQKPRQRMKSSMKPMSHLSQFDPFQEDSNSVSESRSKSKIVRLKKKQLPHIHLPSEQIYLQRIQGAHEVQKKRTIRSKKKKQDKQADKFMDEDNEIYDLDF